MSFILSIDASQMRVTLHAGDPGDAPTSHRHADLAPVAPEPDSPFERPAIATEVLPDGTIRHASWWWPDGRQATVADLEAQRLAAAIRQAMGDADDRRRWRPRVARALWQATRGGRR